MVHPCLGQYITAAAHNCYPSSQRASSNIMGYIAFNCNMNGVNLNRVAYTADVYFSRMTIPYNSYRRTEKCMMRLVLMLTPQPADNTLAF